MQSGRTQWEPKKNLFSNAIWPDRLPAFRDKEARLNYKSSLKKGQTQQQQESQKPQEQTAIKGLI